MTTPAPDAATSSWTVTEAEQQEYVRDAKRALGRMQVTKKALLLYAVLVAGIAAIALAGDWSIALVVLLVVGLGFALCVARSRRSLGRQLSALYPVGFTARTQVEGAGVRIFGANGESLLRWGSVASAERIGSVLALRNHRPGTSLRMFVPGRSIGEESLERLQSGVGVVQPEVLSDPPEPPPRATDDSAVQRWTVTEGDQRAYARQTLRAARPVRLAAIMAGAVVAVMLLMWAVGDRSLGTLPYMLAFAAVMSVFLIWCVVAQSRRAIRAQVERMYPVDFTAVGKAEPDGLRIGHATGEMKFTWGALLVRSADDVAIVVAPLIRPRMRQTLPRQLVSDEALAKMETLSDAGRR